MTEVRDQYENYPYPPRNPADERGNFKYTYTAALDHLNHYHFGGKLDVAKGFRALAAGAGTGDAVIMLGEQLRGVKAEIVYLDISQASMQVAQSRAKERGLDNITWVHGSLLDAPQLLSEKFDYINCAGVLHHLQSPEAGLAALAAVLKEGGVMGLMLYARYGREGVYQMQSLMRILNKGEQDMQRKIDICKIVLNNLPRSNGYAQVQHLATDVRDFGDAGIYDLFLHSQDVAYTVPDVYKFLASSKLRPTHFLFGAHGEGNNLYKLEHYLGGQLDLTHLSLEENQAGAELLHGQIFRHIFYAAKNHAPPPSPGDLGNVPVLAMFLAKDSHKNIANILEPAAIGQEISFQLAGMEVRFVKTPNAGRIFELLDGVRTTGEIIAAIDPAREKELHQEFTAIFRAFHLKDWMFLKAKGIPPFRTIDEIQAAMAVK